jgi:hypothetical protein
LTVPPEEPLSLRRWHERLSAHFGALRRERSIGGGHPLYVLEHGLDATAREQLTAAIRTEILIRPPSSVFWLPWVVYAAEQGYVYAGEEYWQTFEDQTPGWRLHGNRDWLRRSFYKFAKEYNGAQPTGKWAEWFTIICWPITHAVLPLDLQQQLARVLWELRIALRVEHLTDPDRLGALIHARSHTTSTRFANFAQDIPLLGQVATALLLKDASRTNHLLHRPTLDRIAADLERHQVARSWLGEARKRAEWIRLQGTTRGVAASRLGGNPQPEVQVPSAPAPAGYHRSQLGIDPRLALRPGAGGTWTVELEVPELQHLLESDEWRNLLTQSRCKVAGAGPRPLAREAFLFGPKRIPLERWPKADDVLLAFEGASPAVAAALRTTCLLPPGPNWLFKVAADGSAYHIRSGVARTDAEYILLSSRPLDYQAPLSRVEVGCTGIFAGRIIVPGHVPPTVDAVFREHGITRASSVRIAPAGLPPFFWDGEGHVEWLATDTQVISVEREDLGSAVELTLENRGGEGISIERHTPSPTYVELGPLPAGVHTLHVRARSGGNPVASLGGTLEITIREPRSWSGVLTEQHAVQVTSEPADPTLDDLVSGRFHLDVRGPSGVSVSSSATLWSYRRQRQLHRKTFASFRLPFDSGAWHRAFVKHFLDDKPVEQHLDESWAVEVEFVFGSLAQRRFRFVRNLAPLRWTIRRQRKGSPAIRLADDTGEVTPPKVHRRSFEQPDVPLIVPCSGAGAVVDLPEAGGLVTAEQGEHRASVILAPTRVRGFSALKVDSHPRVYRSAPDGLNSLLDLAQLWANASPEGNHLARMYQCTVLRAVHTSIVRMLCTVKWEAGERAFLRAAEFDAHALAREISNDPSQAEFRRRLEAQVVRVGSLSGEARVDCLHAEVTRIREFRDLDVSTVQLALRIMSVPERIGRQSEASLAALFSRPVLMRAARYLVIAAHRLGYDRDLTTIPLYSGWG